jgi:NAD(P)-dependent dehydrogenase (short-subunit alcohol dehydrogenase family)
MHTESTPGAAIVTGASRGLGLAAARSLAGAGHPVVLAARDADALARAAAAIETAGGEALAVPTDVTDEAAVDRLVSAARQRFAAIAAVVNCAAVVALLGERHGGEWAVGPEGLAPWTAPMSHVAARRSLTG